MPTGYTDMIDSNPKLSTKKWMMEGLSRAFGVCVSLREESQNLKEEEIALKIAESGQHDVDWHRKELNKARRQKAKIKKWTPEQWKQAWEKSEAKRERDNARSTKEASKIAKRHAQVRKDLEFVMQSDVDEFTKTIANYGLEQLNITQRECEPYITEAVTLDQFKNKIICDTHRDIDYHKEEMAKAKERRDERIEAYQTLRNDLDKVLGNAKD